MTEQAWIQTYQQSLDAGTIWDVIGPGDLFYLFVHSAMPRTRKHTAIALSPEIPREVISIKSRFG